MYITAFCCMLIMLHSCCSNDVQKRIVLHNELDLDQAFKAVQSQLDLLNMTQEIKIKQLENEIKRQENEIKALKQDRGSTYVRWGRTTCGGYGTQKVYSGFAAGSNYTLKGSAVDYLCLPQHPSWANYVDGYDTRGGQVAGAEYQFGNTMSQTVFGKNLHNEDPPCVVCKTPRPTTLMIPARTQCYPEWTLEYTGYLMSGYTVSEAATEYVCVDSQPEALYHGEANTGGKLFGFVEISCGGLPCQVYPEGRELACVVCSQ